MGKYSYEIFMFQMIYFDLCDIYIPIREGLLHEIIYMFAAVIICCIPIVFVKNYYLNIFNKWIFMEIRDFIEKFAEQFDETDASEFKAETIFKEMDEWSSLIALSVIAMVDEEFDVTLKGDDVRNSNTIEDLYNIVISRL